MKHTIIALAFFTALSVNAQTSNEQTLLTIDNENISRSEFERLYMKNNTEATFDSASLNEYLRLFIDYKLKVTEAEQLGMDTTPEFRSEYDEYCAQLEKPYLTDASIDDSLAHEAYEHMKTDVRASHILIRCPENSSAADTLKAYKRIESIYKRAVKGEDFAKLAKETSEDPSVVRNNGDLNFFTAFSMIYEFEKMAYNTEIGAISPIFRTRIGYHIMKVTDRRPNPGQIRAAHIMLRVPQDADESAQKAAADKIKMIADSLAGGADWAQMVKRYSDDKGSASREGDLQWFSTGSMVPEFEDVAFALKNIGDISAPLHTSYGWHIIKLLDRKPLDSFENLKDKIARNLSRDARSQMAQNAVVERLKKEYNFTENKAALNEFASRIDTSVWHGNWNADKAKGLNKTIFTIADTVKFTQSDYAKKISQQGSLSPNVPVEVIIANDYKKLVDKSILDFERKQLPRKYPDFRYLQTEYHDGILLFALMDKMVWTKASTDSAGLEQFYEANKQKYMWNERVNVVRVTYNTAAVANTKATPAKLNKAILSAIKKDLTKEHYSETVSAAAAKAGAADSVITLRVARNTCSKTDDADVDAMKWKEGSTLTTENNGTTALYCILRYLPPMPKTLNECRGTIISSYQEVLEKEWIEQLRAKHTVKIDEKVFNSMIKKK